MSLTKETKTYIYIYIYIYIERERERERIYSLNIGVEFGLEKCTMLILRGK